MAGVKPMEGIKWNCTSTPCSVILLPHCTKPDRLVEESNGLSAPALGSEECSPCQNDTTTEQPSKAHPAYPTYGLYKVGTPAHMVDRPGATLTPSTTQLNRPGMAERPALNDHREQRDL